MKIGIIGPTKEEITLFNSFVDKKETKKELGLDLIIGKYKDLDVVTLESGIGKVNATIATMHLIYKYNITHFIVLGACGGIDEVLSIPDIVIADKIYHHDQSPDIIMDRPPYIKKPYFEVDKGFLELSKKINQKVYYGSLVTGEAFIEDEGREKIVSKFNPLAVDMETAAMAQTCYILNIPFFSIRSVTDTKKESGMNAFHINLEKAVNASTNYLIKILDLVNEGKYERD